MKLLYMYSPLWWRGDYCVTLHPWRKEEMNRISLLERHGWRLHTTSPEEVALRAHAVGRAWVDQARRFELAGVFKLA